MLHEHAVVRSAQGGGERLLVLSAVLALDLVPDRLSEVAVHDRLHVTVERRREQQDLPLVRHAVEELGDLRHEAHVGHAVGLVDDDDGAARQVELATADEIDETAGGAHGDIDAAAQLVDLERHAGAAVERGHVALRRRSERTERTDDLLASSRVGTSTSALGWCGRAFGARSRMARP